MTNENGLGLSTREEILNRSTQIATRGAMDWRASIGEWSELLGGQELVPVKDAAVVGDGEVEYETITNDYSKGVFAQYPGSTPKYSTRNDSTETMARMLVPIPSYPERRKFVQSFGTNTAARNLAEALAVTEESGSKGDGRFGMGYIDFLLTAAVEAHEEKVQVVDVLSDNYVAYYFGEHPPIFQYQGKLINTEQDDWRNAFSIVYNSIVRGTQLARRRRLVTLTYDNVAVTGTMVGMNQTLTAEMEMAADFSFKILVKRFDIYRRPGITFNPPSGFPNNVVDPSTFGSLSIKRVKKTLRVVGNPQYVVSEPEKKKTSKTIQGLTLY